MRRSLVYLAVLVYSLLCSYALTADVIKLQNGDVISGTIVAMDKETVTVETVYGTIVVNRSFVAEGSFNGGSEIPRSGLVAELTFDAGYRDTSGSGRTVENPAGLAPVPYDGSDDDRYFRSDGNGQYVVIHDGGDLGGMQEFSISLKVIIDDPEKSQYIVSKWNQSSGTTADGKFALNYRAGVLSLYVVDAAGTYHLIQHEQAFPSDRWMNVAIVFTSERVSIYLGGVLALAKEQLIKGFFNDTNPVYVMTAPASTDNRFGHYNVVGGIDDLRIFNRALNDDEVAALAADIE